MIHTILERNRKNAGNNSNGNKGSNNSGNKNSGATTQNSKAYEGLLEGIKSRMGALNQMTGIIELLPEAVRSISTIDDFDKLSKKDLSVLKKLLAPADGIRWIMQSTRIRSTRDLYDMFESGNGDREIFNMLMQQSILAAKGGIALAGYVNTSDEGAEELLGQMKDIDSIDKMPEEALIPFMNLVLDIAIFSFIAEIIVDQHSGASSVKMIEEFCAKIAEPDGYKELFLTVVTKGTADMYKFSEFIGKVSTGINDKLDAIAK